jgi:hypothetical protein
MQKLILHIKNNYYLMIFLSLPHKMEGPAEESDDEEFAELMAR